MPTAPDVVAHLYRRAGFGVTPDQLVDLVRLDLVELVDRLLDRSAEPALPEPPALTDPAAGGWDRWALSVQAWLQHMAATPVPLVEKMTLFWHGHFVSGNDKVNDMTAMWRQVATYRAHALGDLRSLAQAMAVDPAMLAYLDNQLNVAEAPNLNFARELFELFLLGIGNYTEDDIAASARAWTGHTVDPVTRRHVFRPERHDAGMKTLFGRSAAFDGPDVIDLVLDHPVTRVTCARFMARKLWSFFAHPSPTDAIVSDLADVLLATGFRIDSSLRALFLHPAFYAPEARRGLVRTPVEWCVALLRATGLAAADTHPEWLLGRMGQAPFVPPNVAGWGTNEHWITTAAAAGRADHATFVAWKVREARSFDAVMSRTVDDAVDDVLQRFGIADAGPVTHDAMVSWLVAQRAVPWTGWMEPHGLVALAALSPEMQMA